MVEQREKMFPQTANITGMDWSDPLELTEGSQYKYFRGEDHQEMKISV